MDLRLNATRRSINLLVCLVLDLEARRFKFLGENLLGTGELECACHGIECLSFLFASAVQPFNPRHSKKPIGSPL